MRFLPFALECFVWELAVGCFYQLYHRIVSRNLVHPSSALHCSFLFSFMGVGGLIMIADLISNHHVGGRNTSWSAGVYFFCIILAKMVLK